jgi:hypothetical protein
VGLFSLFSSPSPEAAARKIAAKTIQIEVNSGEDVFASHLGIAIDRLVSERILLRVGIAEATVAYMALETKRYEANDVLKSLRAVHRAHFVTRPGIAPEVGARVYERASSRYIMLQPAEIAARFEEQLKDPAKWDQPTYEPQVPASARVISFVDAHMKDIAGHAFDSAAEYVRRSS